MINKNLSSDSSSTSSSDDKAKTKKQTPQPTKTTTKATTTQPNTKTQQQAPKKVSSSSSSSSSSKKKTSTIQPKTSTIQPPKTLAQNKGQVNPPKVNGTKGKKEESSSSSSEDDEPKKVNANQPGKNVNSSNPVKTTGVVPPVVKAAKKEESSSSSSSSSEKVKGNKGKANTTVNKVVEKEKTPQANQPKVTGVAANKNQAKKESSSSEESSSDDKAKKPTEKKAPQAQGKTEGKTESKTETNKPTKKDKEESDSDDSSSSEMHIDLKKNNDVKMTDADQKGVKRKRDNDEPTNAKKRKMNGEGETAAGGGGNKIRVGNLSFELDGCDEDIKKHFEECGEVKSVEMIMRRDGKWAGVAILDFANEEGAKNALNKNNEDFYGRKMSVSYSTDRAGGGGGPRKGSQVSEKPEGCTTVFIGNLNFNITEDQVYEFFQDCGDIKECRWPKGDFTGIGWVEFYDTNATDLAIKKAGTKVMGREIRVDYAAPRKNNF